MEDMKKEIENTRTFDMDALKMNLPQNRRGLSRFYSGKARSFMCLDDVHCLEDLKKEERPDVKKRRKQQPERQVPAFPCCRVSSSTQCGSPIIGV